MEQIKILITNHSLLFNRGSEAVIRSIAFICRYWRPDSYITVATGQEGEVLKEIPDADRIIPRYDSSGEVSHLLAAAKEADIVLVTGADNYDSPYGNTMMEEVNTKLFRETRGKTILYDCSLNEMNFTENRYEDIKRFTAITARESITYELFLRSFPPEKISLYPDPAFLMPTQKCAMPEGFSQGNMIGINISNLILTGKYGANEEKILLSYQNMMNYLLESTNYKIILIQHIVNNGFDLEALEKLYRPYEKEKRVLLMKTELLNAMEIKYVISKLNCLITARTHAAIAAYSTCVPTLAVGYSVKSLGIARDLFGSREPYVLLVREIKDGTELRRKLEAILRHEREIREHLEKVIPSYKMLALRFGEIL